MCIRDRTLSSARAQTPASAHNVLCTFCEQPGGWILGALPDTKENRLKSERTLPAGFKVTSDSGNTIQAILCSPCRNILGTTAEQILNADFAMTANGDTGAQGDLDDADEDLARALAASLEESRVSENQPHTEDDA